MTFTDTTETTNDSAAPDHAAVIDGYFRCWNVTDEGQRRAATEATWAPEATSADPLNAVVGHDALEAMFAGFHELYPGHSFRQRGGHDAHNGFVRWSWEMIDPAGEVVLDGIDVALVGDDARIQKLVGFFGADVPPSSSS